MASPAIRVRGLRKVYPSRPPVEAVNGLDLEVERGECFGLLGPNGAGKTTTIEILEGLQEPTSGTVEILGQSWGRHERELREKLGISLQETRLSEKLTLRETVNLFHSFYARGQDPENVLAEVGLTEKAQTQVGKLSGGQKQRLAIACALVGNPELLFLDEPTTGLDPQSRRQLWDVLRQLRSEGRTILLTTHYMEEAERLCDRVAIVDQGKVIALGTPAELVARLGGDHLIEMEIDGPANLDPNPLARLPGVIQVWREESALILSVKAPHETIPALLQWTQNHGLALSRLATRHTSLEDVFVTLTGRHLRDDGE